MDIEHLRTRARQIWGDDKLELSEIILRLNVVIGDVARIARAQQEGADIDEVELKKEMGNIIFSMIRWCDDMGYDPRECINLAVETQKRYALKVNEKSRAVE